MLPLPLCFVVYVGVNYSNANNEGDANMYRALLASKTLSVQNEKYVVEFAHYADWTFKVTEKETRKETIVVGTDWQTVLAALRTATRGTRHWQAL